MKSKPKVKVGPCIFRPIKLKEVERAVEIYLICNRLYDMGAPGGSPSQILDFATKIIIDSYHHTYVAELAETGQIVACVAVEPLPNGGGRVHISVLDPDYKLSDSFRDSHITLLHNLGFKFLLVSAYKKRKDFAMFLRFLKFVGFRKVVSETPDAIELRLDSEDMTA